MNINMKHESERRFVAIRFGAIFGESLLSRCRRGSVAAEFALVLPLLLLLFTGGMQYGTLLYTYNSMQTIARNGARALASGTSSVETVSAAAKAALPAWVPSGDLTVVAGDTGTNMVHMSLSLPSARATVMRLSPMPDTIDVDVVMRREPNAGL